jgi:hypothetical protein
MPPVIAAIAVIGQAIAAVTTAVEIGVSAIAIAVGATGATALAISTFVATAVVGGALAFGLSEVSSLLTPHSNLGAGSIAWKADPSAGIPYVIGRTGTGGNIIFNATSAGDSNKFVHYLTVLSAGPVDAIEGFTANNIPVSFNSDGSISHIGLAHRGAYSPGTQYNVNDGVQYLGAEYICVATTIGHDPSNISFWAAAGSSARPSWNGRMWQTQTRGLQPDTYLPDIGGAGTIPEWTVAHALSGLCHTRWALQSDTKAFPTGSPKPLWVLRGPAVYDPRQDSTYPGGSGTQRASDPTTWAWSQNPFLHALTWLLGIRANGVRVLGLGAAVAAIDVAAFVTGANVATANGWTCGGVVLSTDSKWDVFVQMLSAGAGVPTRKGAAISCIVQTPRVSIATLTGADVSGACSVQAMAGRRSRINKVIFTYRSEPHQWAAVQADPIVVPAYVAADGVTRAQGVQMPLVQSVTQGAQLARYMIEDTREFGPIVIPLKAVWIGLNPGDCVTVNEPELGLNNQTILILDRKIDPGSGCPTITARSETAGKHPFALGQTGTPPPAPALTGVDLVAPAPNSPPWTAVGTTLTAGGVATPAIVVTGMMEVAAASNLIVRTRTSAGPGPWTHYDSPPAPVAARVEITGVGSGEARDIGLSYLVRGVQGAELVIANVTAGAFAGSGAGAVTTPSPTPVWPNMSASGAGALTASSAAQTIGAITAPITLTLTFTGSGSFSYVKNGAGATPFTSGTAITVAAGDTLGFVVSALSSASGVLTITNTTAGVTLGAPTYTLTSSGAVQTPSPTPVWPAINETTYASAPCVGYTGAVTIAGTSAAISLRLTFTGTGVFAVSVNGGVFNGISSGGTVSANPGDTIEWQASNSTVGGCSGVATVANASAGGAVLSTFNYSVRVRSGPWP